MSAYVAGHRMLPGSHERPAGRQCVCGGEWDGWVDLCVSEIASGEQRDALPDVGSGSPLTQLEGIAAGHAPLCPVIDGGRACTCASPDSAQAGESRD